MQVEITNREMVEIRTGKGKRSTHGGEKTAAPAFILSQINTRQKEIKKSKGGSGANKAFRFHINKNAFQ